MARGVIQARNDRNTFFSKAMFGEPAWDILLHLYTSPGFTLNTRDLVRLVGEPKTTVLRWIGYLEEKRLIRRGDDPADRRNVRVFLVDGGLELLDAYFGSPCRDPIYKDD